MLTFPAHSAATDVSESGERGTSVSIITRRGAGWRALGLECPPPAGAQLCPRQSEKQKQPDLGGKRPHNQPDRGIIMLPRIRAAGGVRHTPYSLDSLHISKAHHRPHKAAP